MVEKKRQHYVPQFYLKNFSETKSSISTFNLEKKILIKNASIRDMCKKEKFYGDDNKVENFLNDEIEQKSADIIKRIIETNEFPTSQDDLIKLLMFILVSEARNLKSGDSTSKLYDFFAKKMLEGDPEFNKLDIDLDTLEIKLNTPTNYLIYQALRSVPLILDLEGVIILNDTSDRMFITSDNPMVRYNSFYMSKNYQNRGYGLVTRGLQLFMPISPKVCLLLYDELAYDIPEKTDRLLKLKRARDIDRLNDLFYLNAYNNIFFNQNVRQVYIENISKNNNRYHKMKQLDNEINEFKSSDSEELIHVSFNRVTKNISLPFIKVSQEARKLILPSHMGGLSRTESLFIRSEISGTYDEFFDELGKRADQ